MKSGLYHCSKVSYMKRYVAFKTYAEDGGKSAIEFDAFDRQEAENYVRLNFDNCYQWTIIEID